MNGFRDFLNECEQHFYAENYKAHDATVAYMYHQDIPLSDIKQEMGLSYGEIYRSLGRYGINPNRRKRPYHSDVLYFGQGGMGLEEISRLTGYSTRQVRNILQANNLMS